MLTVNLAALMNEPSAGFKYSDDLDIMCVYRNREHQHFELEGFAIRTVAELRGYLQYAQSLTYPQLQTFAGGEEVVERDFKSHLAKFDFTLVAPEQAEYILRLFHGGDFGYVLWLGEF